MECENKGQVFERDALDPRQWTDRQVLEFLGTALRNVDLVGEVRLSEIRQGFEVVMGRAAPSQQAEPDNEIPEFTPGNGNRARRRMESLGLTGAGLLHSLSGGRHGAPDTDIDVSEGGHCD